MKSGSAAAVYTWTFTGPATETGVLSFALEDLPFQIVVIAGMTADQVAIAVATELTGVNAFPFTAEAEGAVVTLTAKVPGAVGNWFAPEMNPNFGDQLPPGSPPRSRRPRPAPESTDINPALPVFACAWDVVGLGFEDQPAVDQVVNQIKLNWDCGVQGLFKGGHVIYPKTGTSGTIAAYAFGRNNPEESIVPVEPDFKYRGILSPPPSPRGSRARPAPTRRGRSRMTTASWATSMRRRSARPSGRRRRSAPSTTPASPPGMSRTRAGCGTRRWSSPISQRTYKFNPKTGAPDGAWRQGETRFVVAKFIRELGQWYYDNYSSVSLVNNGTRIPAGKRAISPADAPGLDPLVDGGHPDGRTPSMPARPISRRWSRSSATNQPGNCDPDRVNVLIDLDTVNRLARIATSVDVAPELSCRPGSRSQSLTAAPRSLRE